MDVRLGESGQTLERNELKDYRQISFLSVVPALKVGRAAALRAPADQLPSWRGGGSSCTSDPLCQASVGEPFPDGEIPSSIWGHWVSV